jgi:tripartite-type tricarboxylate transporter receptor subunit TctC
MKTHHPSAAPRPKAGTPQAPAGWRLRMFRIRMTVALTGALLLGGAQAQAQDTDFFAGKTITVLIGYAAGGTYDATARLIARHMGQYIPGHPNIVPQNMPGSGGIKTILHLYSVAPRDGTMLAMLPRSYPIEPAFNPQAAKYDPRKFNPIGSTSQEVSVGVVWHTRGITSLDDLQTKEITTGATGVTDDTGRYPTLLHNLTGAKIKIVNGYPGGNDVTMAMERGEVDARFGWSWGSLKSRARPWLTDKKINILVQMALEKAADLPNTPIITQFAKTELDQKALELLFSPQVSAWPLIAPPEVPADRVTILRKAFQQTMKDPAFLADAEKLNVDVAPVSGEAIQKIVERIGAFDRDVTERALDLTEAH